VVRLANMKCKVKSTTTEQHQTLRLVLDHGMTIARVVSQPDSSSRAFVSEFFAGIACSYTETYSPSVGSGLPDS